MRVRSDGRGAGVERTRVSLRDTRCVGGELGELGWGCLLFSLNFVYFFLLAAGVERQDERIEKEERSCLAETVSPQEW